MAGVLCAELVWGETFMGLRMTQFSGLLKVVRERGGNGTLRGQP
ncbi:IS5/IS1182 family transposase, partial [Streptomyces scabiei]|nr:IS5/IS1182 family transposase [Streptomyces scabiei]MDX3681875.1 IS5/IS1182 family transposase [Streptomyces scabiei]